MKQRIKRTTDNIDIKQMTYCIFGLGIASMMFVLSIAIRNTPLPLQELNHLLPHIFIYVAICLVMVVLFVFIFFMLFKCIDSKALKTAIHLTSNKINNYLLLKNNKGIQPYLLSFLYDTLKLNNDFLKLPLGNDYSALIPNGFNYVCRQGCVFHIFQLIMPEELDVDDNTLKKLTQSYINSELLNYGIAGLNSCFNSRIYGRVPSVVIDRVHYSQHMLNFSVLYVCSEEGARYIINAQSRENGSPKIEGTVYDDEIT